MPDKDAGEPARILIVEDNEGDVFLLSLALKQADFPHRVSVCRDGADAVRFLHKALSADSSGLPELILLDINLPRMDGTTVLETLRAEKALSNIPVILLSSVRLPNDNAPTRQFGKCVFVVKPSNLSAYMEIGQLARDFWTQATPRALAVQLPLSELGAGERP